MFKEKQKKEIIRFLNGKRKKDIDVFSLYQWLDRCFYEGWWDLGLSLSAQIPPNSLSDNYHKRIIFMTNECRINNAKEINELKETLKKYLTKIDADTLRSYELFKSQKNILIKLMKNKSPEIIIELNWKDLNIANIGEKKNWVFVFYPPGWHESTFTMDRIRKGFGVYLSFRYYYERKSGAEFARLYSGVESPIKEEFKNKFKNEIIEELKPYSKDLTQIELWPSAGIRSGGKLLECKIPLNADAANKVFEIYNNLSFVIPIINEKIKLFREKKYFD